MNTIRQHQSSVCNLCSHLRVMVASCFLFSPHSWAGAIDTLSSWTTSSIHSFGELSGSNPGAVTFGQTFRISEGDFHALSLTFRVSDYAPSTAPEPCTFQAVIMAWNGLRPTGPVLFQSDPLVTSGLFANWDTFSLSLDNTPLAQNQPYVVFFTANNYLNGIRSDAAMANVGDVYAQGSFVSHHSGFGFADLLGGNWGALEFVDLAIRLDYVVVPEPTPLMLLGLGSAGLVARRIRRARTGKLR